MGHSVIVAGRKAERKTGLAARLNSKRIAPFNPKPSERVNDAIEISCNHCVRGLCT